MRSSAAKTRSPTPGPQADVDAFFAALRHPLKDAFLELRSIILGADRSIAEGIKWNVSSFRTTEYFATFHLRAKEGVQVIMHLGARARGKSARNVTDPASLLEWLADDRALVRFRDLADVRAAEGVPGARARVALVPLGHVGPGSRGPDGRRLYGACPSA